MSIQKFQDESVLKTAGYKALDFMNTWEITGLTPSEYRTCVTQKHSIEELSFSQHKNLCVCSICKIYWYYDCSD
jgi:hypothetical protein